MIQSEVTVVGAGPAGTIAAHRLARAGVQVLLVEQSTFPRDKTCGDGVTSQGLDVLERSGLGSWVGLFPLMKNIRFSSPDGQVIDVAYPQELTRKVGRLIPRRILDERLAQTAIEAGARLLEGTHVTKLTRETDGSIRLSAGATDIQTQIVILAEGSNAPLARMAGLASGECELLAARQYLSGDSGPADRLEIHFQSTIVPGYSWVFPIGDGYANVGTGTYTRRIQHKEIGLRQELLRFTHDPILEGRLENTEPTTPIRGAPLRTRIGIGHADRVLVTGDAVGLVNPFTGVGIAQAMRSGELAAQTALQAHTTGNFSAAILSGYTHSVVQLYGADQRAARFLRTLLSPPALLNAVFRQLAHKPDLALLLGQIFLAYTSPRAALRPTVLRRLLV